MLKKYKHRGLGLLITCSAVLVTIAGCSTSTNTTSSSGGTPSTQPSKSATSGRGKAEMWAQACNRCHNAWSPDQYSATQWEAIMQHMRLRAGLTREEHDSILQFLPASR